MTLHNPQRMQNQGIQSQQIQSLNNSQKIGLPLWPSTTFHQLVQNHKSACETEGHLCSHLAGAAGSQTEGLHLLPKTSTGMTKTQFRSCWSSFTAPKLQTNEWTFHYTKAVLIANAKKLTQLFFFFFFFWQTLSGKWDFGGGRLSLWGWGQPQRTQLTPSEKGFFHKQTSKQKRVFFSLPKMLHTTVFCFSFLFCRKIWIVVNVIHKWLTTTRLSKTIINLYNSLFNFFVFVLFCWTIAVWGNWNYCSWLFSIFCFVAEFCPNNATTKKDWQIFGFFSLFHKRNLFFFFFSNRCVNDQCQHENFFGLRSGPWWKSQPSIHLQRANWWNCSDPSWSESEESGEESGEVCLVTCWIVGSLFIFEHLTGVFRNLIKDQQQQQKHHKRSLTQNNPTVSPTTTSKTTTQTPRFRTTLSSNVSICNSNNWTDWGSSCRWMCSTPVPVPTKHQSFPIFSLFFVLLFFLIPPFFLFDSTFFLCCVKQQGSGSNTQNCSKIDSFFDSFCFFDIFVCVCVVIFGDAQPDLPTLPFFESKVASIFWSFVSLFPFWWPQQAKCSTWHRFVSCWLVVVVVVVVAVVVVVVAVVVVVGCCCCCCCWLLLLLLLLVGCCCSHFVPVKTKIKQKKRAQNIHKNMNEVQVIFWQKIDCKVSSSHVINTTNRSRGRNHFEHLRGLFLCCFAKNSNSENHGDVFCFFVFLFLLNRLKEGTWFPSSLFEWGEKATSFWFIFFLVARKTNWQNCPSSAFVFFCSFFKKGQITREKEMLVMFFLFSSTNTTKGISSKRHQICCPSIVMPPPSFEDRRYKSSQTRKELVLSLLFQVFVIWDHDVWDISDVKTKANVGFTQ